MFKCLLPAQEKQLTKKILHCKRHVHLQCRCKSAHRWSFRTRCGTRCSTWPTSSGQSWVCRTSRLNRRTTFPNPWRSQTSSPTSSRQTSKTAGRMVEWILYEIKVFFRYYLNKFIIVNTLASVIHIYLSIICICLLSPAAGIWVAKNTIFWKTFFYCEAIFKLSTFHLALII